MSYRKYIFSIIFIAYTLFVISQETILCPLQNEVFKIENSINVPIVTYNGDNTISLTFQDNNATEIFSNYTIYDFYQTFPNSSETLQKYYNITFDTNNLLEDMFASVPADIIVYSGSAVDTTNFPFKTDINPTIIDNLDGNTYRLTKYISTSDTNPCSNTCILLDVPEAFSFIVSFNYDTTEEILYMESYEPTTCGNSFLIGLTGGNPNFIGNTDDTLQLWNTTPGVSAVYEDPQPCIGFESQVFSVLGISCGDFNFGNIDVQFDEETESFQFYREHILFGYHILEFSSTNLSVMEDVFKKTKPFQIEGNPYLQLSNQNNQTIKIEIFNTSGQEIIKSTTFKENSLDLSNMSSGLYFIRLSNLNNQQKVFKFLKN